MLSFVRMRRPSSSLPPVSRSLAIVFLSIFAAGCSADVARFDFPSASLTDKSGTTTGAIPTPSEPVRDRSNLIGPDGSVASGSGDTSNGGAYYPPRSNRDTGARLAALPDASAPPQAPPPATYSPSPAPASEPLAARQPAPSSAPVSAEAQKGQQLEVQPGDTLFGLSKRHHVSVSELMTVNDLKGPALKLGQKLFLPAYRNARLPLTKTAPAETAAAAPVDAPADWSGSYTVKAGDSLYAIAHQHKVKFTDLQRYNGIQDVRRVKPGIVLKMPAGDGTTVSVAPPAATPAPAVQSTSTQPKIINASPSREQKVAALNSLNTANDASSGTAPSEPASGSLASGGKLRWPAQGKIIAGFGQRSDGTHNDGVNLAVPMGTEVHAADGGVVAYAGSELKGYGNLILLRHDNGWVTAYAHGDELLVKRGDKVKRGQVIAKAGKTGQVDQPQVHFELRQGQKPVDPTPFMERL